MNKAVLSTNRPHTWSNDAGVGNKKINLPDSINFFLLLSIIQKII